MVKIVIEMVIVFGKDILQLLQMKELFSFDTQTGCVERRDTFNTRRSNLPATRPTHRKSRPVIVHIKPVKYMTAGFVTQFNNVSNNWIS